MNANGSEFRSLPNAIILTAMLVLFYVLLVIVFVLF